MNRELGCVYYRVSQTISGHYSSGDRSDWFETEDAALITAKTWAGLYNSPVRVEEIRVIHEVTPKRGT